eukprot:m.11491 g.11491  ORF g.11491 m.11491 type:complete len:66 (+) comp23428_c0_seq1:466-663(+)
MRFIWRGDFYTKLDDREVKEKRLMANTKAESLLWPDDRRRHLKSDSLHRKSDICRASVLSLCIWH